MTTPPADPPPQDPPAPGAPIDTRMTALEREQERQGGVLDRIVGLLDTGAGPANPPAPPAGSAAAGDRDMIEQMRQAVRDVRAEEAARTPPPAAPPPEVPPREVKSNFKTRMQGAMFGGDPK